jgi:hypothetical protein
MSTYLYEQYIVQCTDILSSSCTFCAPHMDLSPDSLIKARDAGGLHILEVSLSFSNRDFIYSCLTVPFSLAFFFPLRFVYVFSHAFPHLDLFFLLFRPKFQSLLWFYFLFLTTLPVIFIIFVVYFLHFWHSHSLSSARILFNFCWPMLIL